MAAANIDAVERYIKRIDEYVDDKMHQQKMYKPTVKRIFKLRNTLVKIVNKLDKLLKKFDYQIEEVDSTVCNDNSLNMDVVESNAVRPVEPSSCKLSDLSIEQFTSMITNIVDKRMESYAQSVPQPESQPNNDPSSAKDNTKPVKNEAKSTNNKKIVQAYKQMFEDSKHVNHSSEIIQRTITFLRDWYDVKIMHFYNMKKVSPSLSYNITWIPNWIRDFVVYIGNNQANIEQTFKQLEEFLCADKTDSRYTYMVPYEVTEIGKASDHKNVTELASAIWCELYQYVFQNLAIPEDNACYCKESLIDYAYLTDAEIEDVSLNTTSEFYEAVNWLKTFKFN